MKAKERHQLKQNDFAETTTKVIAQMRENRDRLALIVGGVVVAAVLVGGYSLWRKSQNDKAGALLGLAYTAEQGTIAPLSTLPGATQQPGTFPTERARNDAAMKAFQEVVAKYPSSKAAIVATYEMAGLNLELGRFSDAEAEFNKVIAEKTEPYASTAALGLAQALLDAGKTDEAVKVLTDLSGNRDGALPVDGVLVQLARADLKAGKKADARAAYKRIVDEFADSQYAADARQALTTLE